MAFSELDRLIAEGRVSHRDPFETGFSYALDIAEEHARWCRGRFLPWEVYYGASGRPMIDATWDEVVGALVRAWLGSCR